MAAEAKAKYDRDWSDFSARSSERHNQRVVAGIGGAFLGFSLVPFILDTNDVGLHPLLRLLAAVAGAILFYAAFRLAQGCRKQNRAIAFLAKNIEHAHSLIRGR